MLSLGNCIIHFYSQKLLLQISALPFASISPVETFAKISISVCLTAILLLLRDDSGNPWSRKWFYTWPVPQGVRRSLPFLKPPSTSIDMPLRTVHWKQFMLNSFFIWETVQRAYPSDFLIPYPFLVPFWWSTFQVPLSSHSKSCFLASVSSHHSLSLIPLKSWFLLRPADTNFLYSNY